MEPNCYRVELYQPLPKAKMISAAMMAKNCFWKRLHKQRQRVIIFHSYYCHFCIVPVENDMVKVKHR